MATRDLHPHGSREETLFGRDYPQLDDVLPRLQDRLIRDVWSLWEARLTPEKMNLVRSLLTGRAEESPEAAAAFRRSFPARSLAA